MQISLSGTTNALNKIPVSKEKEKLSSPNCTVENRTSQSVTSCDDWNNMLYRLSGVDLFNGASSNIRHHSVTFQILQLNEHGEVIDDGRGLHYWVEHLNVLLMAGQGGGASDEAKAAALEVKTFLRRFKESLAEMGITFSAEYIVTIGTATEEAKRMSSTASIRYKYGQICDEDIARVSEMKAFLREFRLLFEQRDIIITSNLIDILAGINKPFYDYVV